MRISGVNIISNMKDGNKRPRLEIPITKPELFGQFLSVAGLIFTVVMFATMYKDLPATVPTHFDFAGNVNGWSSKTTLIFLPIISFFMFIVFTVLERFPHTYNFNVAVTEENAPRLYKIARIFMTFLKADLVWLFGCLFYFSCRAAVTEQTSGLGLFTGLGVGVTLVLVAAFMVLLYKNK